jgi:hypothetical protein
MIHPEERVPCEVPRRRSAVRRGVLAVAGSIALTLLVASPSAYAQRRGAGQTTDPRNAPRSASAPLPNFRGVIKQIDAKSITLALDDHRELEFKRSDKTKFFKDGGEIKSPAFKAGEQVSVEAQEDMAGYLVAVNVYWEKSVEAAAVERGGSGDAGAVDTWSDKPATEVKPQAAKPDAEDPGPPQLRRGRPADPSREHAAELPQQPPQTAASRIPVAPPGSASERPAQPAAIPSIRPDEDLVFGSRQADPLIRKAANAALDFTEGLPNYVCQELVSRYESQTSPANWHAVDVLSMEVVYENGKENYRNITIDGKPTKKPLEDSGGAWSTGEFGTILIGLFSPDSAAQFNFRRDSRAAGILAKEYSFSVARENSHWTVRAGSQTYMPAYSGAVWIDPANARVLRIEMEAKNMPEGFPTDHVESATDYQYVRLGGVEQFLLPVHAEILSCLRGSNNCMKNAIDFRNYHKFEGQSNITFQDVKP